MSTLTCPLPKPLPTLQAHPTHTLGRPLHDLQAHQRARVTKLNAFTYAEWKAATYYALQLATTAITVAIFTGGHDDNVHNCHSQYRFSSTTLNCLSLTDFHDCASFSAAPHLQLSSPWQGITPRRNGWDSIFAMMNYSNFAMQSFDNDWNSCRADHNAPALGFIISCAKFCVILIFDRFWETSQSGFMRATMRKLLQALALLADNGYRTELILATNSDSLRRNGWDFIFSMMNYSNFAMQSFDSDWNSCRAHHNVPASGFMIFCAKFCAILIFGRFWETSQSGFMCATILKLLQTLALPADNGYRMELLLATNSDSRLKTIFRLLSHWDYGNARFGNAVSWNLGALSSLGSICSDIALIEMALSQCEKAISHGGATLLQLVALGFEAAPNGLVVALKEVRKQHGDDAWALTCMDSIGGLFGTSGSFVKGTPWASSGQDGRPPRQRLAGWGVGQAAKNCRRYQVKGVTSPILALEVL